MFIKCVLPSSSPAVQEGEQAKVKRELCSLNTRQTGSQTGAQTERIVVALGVSVGCSALFVNMRPSTCPAVMDGFIWRVFFSVVRLSGVFFCFVSIILTE